MFVNTYDYCLNNGDYTFKEKQFNYVDGLIFSQLSYIDFSELFTKKKMTICELVSKLISSKEKFINLKNNSFIKDELNLLFLMAKTRRYKNVKAYNYVSKIQEDIFEQFGAIMFDISLFTSVIAFRGTDETIIGWKEDFQLSYKDVYAQHDAVKYLNKYCLPLKKYIVLGHSKGGNLSLYGAVNCKSVVKNRIKKVVSYDGPGLRDDSYSVSSYNKIKNKFIKFIPSFDIVGLIFDNDCKKVIIKSSGNGFNQHFASNWLVEGDSFVETSSIEDNSMLIKSTFENFLSNTTLKDRELFFNELFDVIEKENIKSIFDVNYEKILSFFRILQRIGNSDETRKIAGIFINGFLNAFGNKVTFDLKKSFSKLTKKHSIY